MTTIYKLIFEPSKFGVLLVFMFVLFLFLSFSVNSSAAVITSTATGGNWSNIGTWDLRVPLDGDDVVIASGAIVTVDVTDKCNSLIVNTTGASGSALLQISPSQTLEVITNVTISRPGGGFNSELSVGTGALTVGGGVVLDGENTGTSQLTKLTVSSGLITVTGDITSKGSDSQVIFSGAGTLNIGGSLLSDAVKGSLVASIGTVNYTGSNQVLSAFTYYNLTSSGSGVKTMNGNVTVEHTLDFASASKIATDAYELSIGVAGSADGSITSAASDRYIIAYKNLTVNGYVKRFVNSKSVQYSFPIGDASNYTPFALTLNAISGALSSAYVKVNTDPNKLSGLNTSLATYLTRNWYFAISGVTDPTFDLTYIYATADVHGTEANLRPIMKDGVSLFAPANVISLTGVTKVGSYSADNSSNTLNWTGLISSGLVSAAGDEAMALPVSLLSIDAVCESDAVSINWVTASESGNDYFQLERSNDLNHWTAFPNVEGAGNSNAINRYSVIDAEKSDLVYYRLKQVDFDGKFEIFNVFSAACKHISNNALFHIHQNQATGGVEMAFYSSKKEDSILDIINLQGETVYQEKYTFVEGLNGFKINGLNLNKNVYIARLSTSSGAVYSEKCLF